MKVKIRLKRFVRPIACWLVILQTVISLLNATVAISGTTVSNSSDQYVLDRQAKVFSVLSVLENKMGNKKLLEKAKNKLFTLNDMQTRLITSLSEQIANEGETMGADIAFLLITVLIILS